MSFESRINVHKFGGEAVGTSQAFMKSADFLQRYLREGEKVVVVVSAMATMTDQLHAVFQAVLGKESDTAREGLDEIRVRHLNTIRELGGSTEAEAKIVDELRDVNFSLRSVTTDSFTRQKRDAIVSVGERMSPHIFALALKQSGISCVVLDVRKIVRTDSRYGNARPRIHETLEQAKTNLLPELERNQVVVMGGYMGRDSNGYTTTLGRGGSDFTATILARILYDLGLEDKSIKVFLNKADSRIKGIMTGDPKYVHEPKEISHLTRRMARSLSRMGAKVLHERAVEPLEGTDIALICQNILYPENPGTLIDGNPDEARIKAVTAIFPLRGFQINCSPDDRNAIAFAIYHILRMSDIPLRASIQEIGDDSFQLIFEGDGVELDFLRREISSIADCKFDLEGFDDCSAVGVIGADGSEKEMMKEIIGGELYRNGDTSRGEKILHVSKSPGLTTVIFDQDRDGAMAKDAVRVLHQRFFNN